MPKPETQDVMKASSPFVLRHSFVIRISSFFLLLSATSLQAGSSANYNLAPDTLDSGGLRGTSANYTLNSSAMPGGHGTSAAYTLRVGFAGQLADAIATAIDISASPLTVNEGSTRQLGGTLIFDDLSTTPLLASVITWSIQSGPIASIDSSGLATAATVYQNTSAVVQGTYQSLNDTLTLTVINSLPDNFGSYASDGIDDDWQVQYFGLNNPLASPLSDPDFDGQNNHFEFIAGIVPTDPLSRFQTLIQSVSAQPTHKEIIFSPRLAGRTYTVTTSTLLQPLSWSTLTTGTFSDNGTNRTVTDSNAIGLQKFYRVEITRP